MQRAKQTARDAKEFNPKIVAGDFNVWAVEWGSRKTNVRERILLEVFFCLSIAIVDSDPKALYVYHH